MHHASHFVTNLRLEEEVSDDTIEQLKEYSTSLFSPGGTPRPFFERFNVLVTLTMSRQRPVIYATAARQKSGMCPTVRSMIVAPKKATPYSQLHRSPILTNTCSPVRTHQPQPSAMAARRCARQQALWHLYATASSLLVSTKTTSSQHR